VLSKTKLAPGTAIIQLFNAGEDPHNLRIRKVGGGAVHRNGELEPRETGEQELHLGRGKRYGLWCSLPAQRERGMKATLRVSRK